jgi:hypothetical protein
MPLDFAQLTRAGDLGEAGTIGASDSARDGFAESQLRPSFGGDLMQEPTKQSNGRRDVSVQMPHYLGTSLI